MNTKYIVISENEDDFKPSILRKLKKREDVRIINLTNLQARAEMILGLETSGKVVIILATDEETPDKTGFWIGPDYVFPLDFKCNKFSTFVSTYQKEYFAEIIEKEIIEEGHVLRDSLENRYEGMIAISEQKPEMFESVSRIMAEHIHINGSGIELNLLTSEGTSGKVKTAEVVGVTTGDVDIVARFYIPEKMTSPVFSNYFKMFEEYDEFPDVFQLRNRVLSEGDVTDMYSGLEYILDGKNNLMSELALFATATEVINKIGSYDSVEGIIKYQIDLESMSQNDLVIKVKTSSEFKFFEGYIRLKLHRNTSTLEAATITMSESPSKAFFVPVPYDIQSIEDYAFYKLFK